MTLANCDDFCRCSCCCFAFGARNAKRQQHGAVSTRLNCCSDRRLSATAMSAAASAVNHRMDTGHNHHRESRTNVPLEQVTPAQTPDKCPPGQSHSLRHTAHASVQCPPFDVELAGKTFKSVREVLGHCIRLSI